MFQMGKMYLLRSPETLSMFSFLLEMEPTDLLKCPSPIPVLDKILSLLRLGQVWADLEEIGVSQHWIWGTQKQKHDCVLQESSYFALHTPSLFFLQRGLPEWMVPKSAKCPGLHPPPPTPPHPTPRPTWCRSRAKSSAASVKKPSARAWAWRSSEAAKLRGLLRERSSAAFSTGSVHEKHLEHCNL